MQMDEEDLQWIKEEIAKNYVYVPPPLTTNDILGRLRFRVNRSHNADALELIIDDVITGQRSVAPFPIRY